MNSPGIEPGTLTDLDEDISIVIHINVNVT